MQFRFNFKIFKSSYFRSPDFWIIIFFNILTFRLISTWFGSHRMLATAEEGLPFYNSVQTLHSVQTVWQNIDLGYASPFVTPLLSLFGFTALMQIVGFAPWFAQAILFYIYVVAALISMYFLCKLLLEHQYTWIVGLMASCFYLFNLYTYSQVWGRFIYSLFSLWTLLPLFLFFWIQWIQSYKIRYLLFFLLASLLFSSAFALPSSVLTVWVPAGLYAVFNMCISPDKIKKILVSVSGLIVWFVSNVWWIFPLWIFRNGSSLGTFGGQTNISALEGVSRYFPLNQIFFLEQSYLFGSTNAWGVFYSQQKPIAVSFIIFMVVLLGIFFSRKYKNGMYLILLFLVSLFVVKGSNPPFGEQFYTFLFSHISLTQVLRNPYEKFGTAFLLPYALFFGIGIGSILSFSKKITLIPIFFFCFALFFAYLVQPLWNGDVFPEYVRITVPTEYKNAREYIDHHTKGRIFSLPFLNGSAVQFTWGYQGEEPSEYLFDRAVISKFISTSAAGNFYSQLGKYLNNENFTKILSVMSVDSIVVHNDVTITSYYQNDYSSSNNIVQQWKGVIKPKNFGDLTVYTMNQDQRLGEIYGINHLKTVNSLKNLFDTVVSDGFDPHSEGLIYHSDKKRENTLFTSIMPTISYTKLSSNRYTIYIKNASKPFVLVLTSTYDPRWQANSDNQIFSDHFEVNGFANAWVIPKQGNYSITVVYKILPWE